MLNKHIKKVNRILSMLLAVVMTVGSIPAFPVFAADEGSDDSDVISIERYGNDDSYHVEITIREPEIEDEEITAEIRDDASFTVSSERDGADVEVTLPTPEAEKEYWGKFSGRYFYDNVFNEAEKEYYDKLYDYGMKLLTENVDVKERGMMGNTPYYYDSLARSGMGLEGADIKRITEIFRYENPQFYFFNTIFVYGGSGKSGTCAVYHAFIDGDDRAVVTEKFKNKIESWYDDMESHPEIDTDLEKEKFIHDKIVDNISYRTGSTEYDQSSYSVLGEYAKSTVCAGYAQSFELLMNGLGIDTVAISGGSGGRSHEWNKVKIQGNWYVTDVTWGDTTDSYSWFNRSEEAVDRLDTQTDGYINGERNYSHNEKLKTVSDDRRTIPVWPVDTPRAEYDSDGRFDFLGKLSVPGYTEKFVYDGSINKVFADTDLTGFTVTGELAASEAGQYKAYISLEDSAHYTWTDGSTGAKEINWTIAPREVQVSALKTDFVANGCIHIPDVIIENTVGHDECNAIFSGDIEVSEPGKYTVTVSGLDNPCYRLPDETVSIPFVIHDASLNEVVDVSANIIYDGHPHILGTVRATGYEVAYATDNALADIDASANSVRYEASANIAVEAGKHRVYYRLKKNGLEYYNFFDSFIDRAGRSLIIGDGSDSYSYVLKADEAVRQIVFNIDDNALNDSAYPDIMVFSDAPNVAAASIISGRLTVNLRGSGRATITLKAPKTANYKEAVATVVININREGEAPVSGPDPTPTATATPTPTPKSTATVPATQGTENMPSEAPTPDVIEVIIPDYPTPTPTPSAEQIEKAHQVKSIFFDKKSSETLTLPADGSGIEETVIVTNDAPVNWLLNNIDIAEISKHTEDGITLKIKNPGTFFLTACSGRAVKSIKYTVKQSVVSVNASVKEVTVRKGEFYRLSYTPDRVNTNTFKWFVEDEGKAYCSVGKYTGILKGREVTTEPVKVVIAAYDGKTEIARDTVLVNVTDPGDKKINRIECTGLRINLVGGNRTMHVGSMALVTADIIPVNCNIGKPVNFKSSGAVKVDKYGHVTAKKFGKGYVWVKCGDATSSKIEFNVKEPLKTMKVNKLKASVKAPAEGKTKSVSFKLLTSPSCKNLVSRGGKVSWKVYGDTDKVILDERKTKDGKGVFIVKPGAEDTYVTVTVKDGVSPTVYSIDCLISIK